ncbi:MAG: glycine cleavage T C-terminal barrel domain-containing protein, partial [Pirellulales bacterium]
GLIDVSTLGKLEIAGTDAAELIERIYTGRFAKMKPGTSRYGLMCDESGVIIDDGVIGRLADERFYVTTTTTASGSIYREMQRWAILWKLDVVLANVTGAFAAMNLAGPRARSILAELSDVDTRESSFPYLALREAKVLDVACRILRTGFVGEVGYEIHVPAQWAGHLWDGILQAGASAGIRPFGVEAQRVLRLEKGHVIVSQDTDGLTTPFEAGMTWAVKGDKPFFVGGRSLQILARKPLKRQLVGFTLPHDVSRPLPSECHLVIDRGQIVGRVTSIVHSPTLSKPIGLAYVPPSQSLFGARFQIRGEAGRMIEATVVELPFYDRTNARQRQDAAVIKSPSVGEALGVRRQASGAGLPLRTSPVHEQLQQLRPTWASIGDMPVAQRIGDETHERAACARLGLADVSALARVTLKGPNAAEVLSREGLAPPERIYECSDLAEDGGIIIRTGRAEFLVEDPWDGTTVERLRQAVAASSAGVLAVWRQDVSLALVGSETLGLLSQVCSFNFRDADRSAVMTQLAGVSVMLLRRQWQGLSGYQLWADGTYGPYLWNVLLGIARDLGGDAVGTGCLI